MARRPPAQWKDIPASGELAALVRCEAEFVWERNTGRTAPAGNRELRSRTGQQVHAQTQRDMERFHNSRRHQAAAKASTPGRPAPAPTQVAPLAPPSLDRSPASQAAKPHSSAPQAPAPHIPGPASGSDRRCFVASAIYGPDDPRTDALRRYRDTRLLPSVLGRAAVRFYYFTSPALVFCLDVCPALRPWATRCLDRLLTWLP